MLQLHMLTQLPIAVTDPIGIEDLNHLGARITENKMRQSCAVWCNDNLTGLKELYLLLYCHSLQDNLFKAVFAQNGHQLLLIDQMSIYRLFARDKNTFLPRAAWRQKSL